MMLDVAPFYIFCKKLSKEFNVILPVIAFDIIAKI